MSNETFGQAALDLPLKSLSVTLEASDNGVILVGRFQNGSTVTTRRAGIQAKDLASDQARRRIQRNVIKWTKVLFDAPKRVVKADAVAGS